MTWAIGEKSCSQRRACALVGLHPKTYRHRSKRASDDGLRERLRELGSGPIKVLAERWIGLFIGEEGGFAVTDLFLLSQAQMRRIERYFPRSHGIARVDDRRIVSAIVFVIKNGLRWRDAPRDYGPHKTIYNRFIRWSRLGVFNKIFAALAHKGGKPERIMIDATHLKAHRTAASLLKKGLFPDVSGAPRAA